MTKSIRIFKISIFIIFLFSNFSFALETDTHKAINLHIAETTMNGFSLDRYLTNNLGISEGIEKMLDGRKVKFWLRDGGEYEDIPAFYLPYVRSFNHFHNPLTNQGISSAVGAFESALFWAQKLSGTQSPGGHYSWHDARSYYFWALTSLDLNSRNTYFAETFRGLGQLMHLVQDMSVPEHTRNDGHLLYNYEKWAKIEINKDTIPNYQPVYFDKALIGQPNPLATVPIANLFDTNQYTGSNPSDITQNNVGLSEYTNSNFFSSDTIFKTGFPYPAWSSVIESDELDGAGRVKTYLKKIRDGEIVNHLAVGKWFYKYLPASLKSNGLKLDDTVYSDYAQKLIPRAVGYSAGLLNYFFRGEMAVSALPVFYNNSIGHVKAKIKNITPTQEAMSNGYFVLMYRYTPTGAPADGSGDVFGYASNAPPVSTLPYGNELDAVFDIYPQIIPKENYSSLRFMLVFKGTLGAEEGAVIGRHFTLGEVKFSEEWDNGLTGNHTWGHTGYNFFLNQNPNNGATSNVLVNGVLIKDNIRHTGYSSARVNETFVSVYQPSYKDILPIPITPDTYIEFKINRLEINPKPPDPPGTTSHWQVLNLYFNNNMRMQISTDQFVGLQTPTCYLSFDINYIVVDNFYRMFMELCGMSVPEQLKLEGIDFVQQISYTPDSKEYHQTMEVDFIRIIDMKQTQ